MSQACTAASRAAAPTAEGAGSLKGGSGTGTSASSGPTAANASAAVLSADSTSADGSPLMAPEGANGSPSGPGPPVSFAAYAIWSPAACWRTCATVHFSQGVGRLHPLAGTPATTVRNA